MLTNRDIRNNEIDENISNASYKKTCNDNRFKSVDNTDKNDELNTSNVKLFKIVIKAQLMGKSALPYQLGLNKSDYLSLLSVLNDELLFSLDANWYNKVSKSTLDKSSLLAELFEIRHEERLDLINLLLSYRDKNQALAIPAATVIATACLSSSHLWKTLAFNERRELSRWIAINFPELALLNKQMRWKRFFYLQLCKQGGDYICRAPSCDECSSFNVCFLDEPEN